MAGFGAPVDSPPRALGRLAISSEQGATAFVALLFALAVAFTPWEAFGGVYFYDFYVYVETFRPGTESVWEMHAPSTLVEIFTREVLWDEFVRLFVGIAGDPVIVLRGISVFVLWLNSYLLYRRYGFLMPTVLLLNPLFLDFTLSQLRLAFAMAILLVALYARPRPVSILLALAALFIHSATPIFVTMFLVVKYVERHGQDWQLHRILLLGGSVVLVFVVLLAFGRDALLLAIGDRRAFVYAESPASASLSYVLVWMGVLVMQVMAGRDYLRQPDNLYAAMNIFLFVGLTLAGTYGSRFAAAAFPLVAASLLNLPPENRNFVIPVFLVFQVLQFLYWFAIVY
jgi:hypothetical protein